MLQRNSGSFSSIGKTCQSDRSLSVVPSDDEYGPGAGDSIVSQVCILVLCHEHLRQNLSSDFVLSDKLSEEMVQGVFSDDQTRQLDATTKFRKLVTLMKKSLIEPAIECGVVPRLVQFLQGDHAILQVSFVAFWVHTTNHWPTSKVIHYL